MRQGKFLRANHRTKDGKRHTDFSPVESLHSGNGNRRKPKSKKR